MEIFACYIETIYICKTNIYHRAKVIIFLKIKNHGKDKKNSNH